MKHFNLCLKQLLQHVSPSRLTVNHLGQTHCHKQRQQDKRHDDNNNNNNAAIFSRFSSTKTHENELTMWYNVSKQTTFDNINNFEFELDSSSMALNGPY